MRPQRSNSTVATTVFATVALLGLGQATVWAQEATLAGSAGQGYVEGDGIQIGESTVLYPRVGISTGVVSNVFYEENNPNVAGLLRIDAEFGVGSMSGARMQNWSSIEGAKEQTSRGTFEYRADLRLGYDEYLSGVDEIQAQRDLDIGARLRALIFPERTIAFTLEEHFRRETRPTNFESADGVDRDINVITARMLYQPDGRSISGHVRFVNTVDVFEDDDQGFANRLQNTLGARVNWQWLPVTRFTGDVSVGFYSGLGADSTKVSSVPLRVNVGMQSALTAATSISTAVGYGRGFYASGPDFSNITFNATFGWNYTETGRMAVTYLYDFDDSVNANFYRDHALRVGFDQVVNRYLFAGAAELRLRNYRGIAAPIMGPADRDDVIGSINLGVARNFSDWLAGTVDYKFAAVQTDYRYMATDQLDDPSYVRHDLMVGVRAAL